MKLELRNYRPRKAEKDDCLCFSAQLWVNGQYAAYVSNDGTGWVNHYVPVVLKAWRGFCYYVDSLPPELPRADDPIWRVRMGPLWLDDDCVIADLCNAEDTRRRERRKQRRGL